MTNLINSFIIGAEAPAEIITDNGVFDFDADEGVTTDVNGVTIWEDQLVNVGNLIFGAVSARQPDLITNGNPNSDGDAIDFDGNARLFVSGGFTFTSPVTYYIVARQNTWTQPDILMDGNAITTAALRQGATSANVRLVATEMNIAENSDWALNTWGIICYIFDGASSSIRVNNNTKTTGDTGASNPAGLTVGSGGGFGNPADVRFARILGYDTAAHTDAEQSQNITALNDIYTVF